MSAVTHTPEPAQPTVGLLGATRALARRDLKRAQSMPAVTVQSVVFPAVLLATLLAVFGTTVGELDGTSYVQRITPAMIISGAAFGSLGAVTGLLEDRTSGFFDRIRLAPFDRPGEHGFTALALARSVSEHIRVLVATFCITALGYAFGFRFEAGPIKALAFFALAMVFGACFCWIGFALAARASSMEAVVPPVSGMFLILLFLSYGMVPLEAFPGWIQPVVRVAPSSVMMLALQRLSSGGAWVGPVLGAFAWTIGISAVFGALTIRGLTRSTRSPA